VDLAEAADQTGLSIDLGDKQVDIDNLGRMDDRPRQATSESPGRIDRWKAANVAQRAVGDVMLEGGDRVGAGATLIDRGSYSGMDPDFVRRQTEGNDEIAWTVRPDRAWYPAAAAPFSPLEA
jgi:hypothetical protein